MPFSALVTNVNCLLCLQDDQRHRFYNSSGVFYLPATAPCLKDPSAHCPWEDRSSPEMVYWTKELVVDPTDKSGSTWFACVFAEWGLTRRPGAPTRGGLYRTTDRGASWSGRLDGVTVCHYMLQPLVELYEAVWWC